jgi:hypothetical protein
MSARDNTSQSQFGTQLLHTAQAAQIANNLTNGALGEAASSALAGLL